MDLTHKIGLGSVQFGQKYGITNGIGKTPPSEVGKILELAQKTGIKMIDTASAYGTAEKVLGEAGVCDFKIVSKFLPPEPGHNLSEQLESTLNNLKKDSIYGYLAHRPVDLAQNPIIWKELQQLRADNKVEKIGFSLNNPNELPILMQMGMIPDLVQTPYNYLDKRFETALIQLKSIGCEIHTRSTFLQGLFFSDINKLSDYFNDVKPLIGDLQKERHLSAALLNFVLTKEFIDTVVIGVQNVEQLKDNLKFVGREFNLAPITCSISENILIPSTWPLS